MNDSPARPYHHGDLKRVVIETAMAMLQEDKGWQYTLREVARRAGVSHAAPYKHFPDKAALLAELALLGFDRLCDAMTAAGSVKRKSWRSEFLAVTAAYVQFGIAYPALYRLMFSADAGKPADVHLTPRARRGFAIIHEILERGQQEGILRKRPVLSQVAACWAQVHGLTLLTIDGVLLPEKVGADAMNVAIATLLEGLEAEGQ